jgi:hypothetical protein
MKPLSISDQRIKDFELFATLTAAQLLDAKQAVAGSNTYMMTVDELTERLKPALGQDAAQKLSTHVVSLSRIISDTDESVDEVIGALTEGLKRKGWDTGKFKADDGFFSILRELASDEKFKVAAKASDLYYQHSLHLHQLKIITDLRPVFDGERQEVVGMICKNVLHIQYADGLEKEQSTEITIGIDDLEKLVRDAKAAIEKSKISEDLVTNKLKLPIRTYKAHGN